MPVSLEPQPVGLWAEGGGKLLIKDKDGGILLVERDIAGKFAHRAARHPFLAEWVGIVYNGDEPGAKGEKPGRERTAPKANAITFHTEGGKKL